MKKRLKAYMLGTLVTACVLSGTFHAGEEAAVEPISEAAVLKEEAAEADADGGQFAPYYDQMKASVTSTLDQLSAMTDEQLQPSPASPRATTCGRARRPSSSA